MTVASPLQPALEVHQAGKEYRIYRTPRDRMLALLTGQRRYQSHWALQDVSFELRKGQCLGLVGDNGAGKSTLLKLVAGTLQPTTGRISRRGRVTAILELGAGFHPEFTGRENLYFGGNLIGIPTSRMREIEPSIIAFSELGDAIDRPVKTYSSGMVVRLAFALVTAVEPDVLIIDEALAVGDQHFQKKCVQRIEEFRANGCAILFCSHSLYHIRHLCDVALWLHQGRPKALGPTEAVLAEYEVHVRAQEAAAGRLAQQEAPSPARPAPPPGEAAILSVEIHGLGEGELPQLPGPDLTITVRARGTPGDVPSIGIMLEQLHGVGITSVATHADGARPVQQEDGTWCATLTFPDLPLHSGQYVVSAYLFDGKGLVVCDQWYHYRSFQWSYPSLTPGLVRLPHRWS